METSIFALRNILVQRDPSVLDFGGKSQFSSQVRVSEEINLRAMASWVFLRIETVCFLRCIL